MSELELQYDISGGGAAASALYKKVAITYTDAVTEGEQLFDCMAEEAGAKGLQNVNLHPGEIVEVHPALYEAFECLEEAEGTDKVWSGARIKTYLVNEAYRGDILTNKWVKLDYLAGKQVPNKGQQEQFYLEQHHEPLVDTEVFDTVQEYVQKGYLNTQNGKLRKGSA